MINCARAGVQSFKSMEYMLSGTRHFNLTLEHGCDVKILPTDDALIATVVITTSATAGYLPISIPIFFTGNYFRVLEERFSFFCLHYI